MHTAWTLSKWTSMFLCR